MKIRLQNYELGNRLLVRSFSVLMTRAPNSALAFSKEKMMKTLFALAAASVVVAAVPAQARTYSDIVQCVKVVDGRCNKWDRLTDDQAAKARWKMGYVFGPSYSYTAINTIPQNYVTEYGLDPNGRYVYQDGYIYVVDPTTYAVNKIIYTAPH
jgi:hypothetical protein